MNTGGLLGGRGVAENTYQVQFLILHQFFFSRNVLENGRVGKAGTIFSYIYCQYTIFFPLHFQNHFFEPVEWRGEGAGERWEPRVSCKFVLCFFVR